MLNGKKVGLVASCFDLFHAGHILMLQEAKTQCNHLIVALQTGIPDRPEKNQPIQSVFERFQQVAACRYVDEILPYESEQDLLNLLSSLLPIVDVRIIGEEYKDKNFTGKQLDIPVYYNKRRHNYSTSELRERIYNSEVSKNVNRK